MQTRPTDEQRTEWWASIGAPVISDFDVAVDAAFTAGAKSALDAIQAAYTAPDDGPGWIGRVRASFLGDAPIEDADSPEQLAIGEIIADFPSWVEPRGGETYSETVGGELRDRVQAILVRHGLA